MHDATVPRSQFNPLPEFPRDGSAWAVFLDVDGTLLEIAPAPNQVVVPVGLGSRLAALEQQLDGALALISGRSVGDIDRLFAPHRFSIGGVHGAELRIGGTVRHLEVDPTRLDPVRQAFHDFTVTHPGTLWEDKRFAVTIHHRQRPEVGAEARTLASALAREIGEDLQVIDGKMVVEIRFGAATKGTAVKTFVDHPPFAARTPVYLGDDRTDEDAFTWVNDHGGISIVVGAARPSHAAHRLEGVPEAHGWIEGLARHLQSVR